ncbi:hypothetical protein SDC9_206260 [bioreactor metagenome]|uniref:DUF1232 domain-containing protein n=1 Tax=bioreactor metagenome TaxID=1076179 RepID=A0A645JDR7_9ZZZZ
MAKLTILGALGYFISPIDFFPDMLPGGYADDIAIIIGALLTVAIHVNDVARNLAREKLHNWFGNYDEADLHELEARIDRHRGRKD